jgi:hypothetical protein
MVIEICDIAVGADTSEQGYLVHDRIRSELQASGTVVISFQRISTATSSFVNAAIVPLLSVMSLADLKANVRIVDSTRQINEMIKRCLEREKTSVAA